MSLKKQRVDCVGIYFSVKSIVQCLVLLYIYVARKNNKSILPEGEGEDNDDTREGMRVKGEDNQYSLFMKINKRKR